jgi:hypothetical protein
LFREEKVVKEPDFEEIRKRLERITPERQRIARIFKDHIEKAIDELGPGYVVDLQGKFEVTPIRITVEISPVSTHRSTEQSSGRLV